MNMKEHNGVLLVKPKLGSRLSHVWFHLLPWLSKRLNEAPFGSSEIASNKCSILIFNRIVSLFQISSRGYSTYIAAPARRRCGAKILVALLRRSHYLSHFFPITLLLKVNVNVTYIIKSHLSIYHSPCYHHVQLYSS